MFRLDELGPKRDGECQHHGLMISVTTYMGKMISSPYRGDTADTRLMIAASCYE